MASDNVLARDVCSRQILKTTVAALCLNAGYESTQDIVLETLTEILQSCKCFLYSVVTLLYQIQK